ncbi:unnamed protein product [Caenorhabditis bovis]|uniref:ARID domain-containing protein n=1 Tax=Caenorhabditis bovis TaxID=2654633 RepID=A0A8S1E8P9_9PELO|nr:unnamed protein product [Caenorhabditis bovis]
MELYETAYQIQATKEKESKKNGDEQQPEKGDGEDDEEAAESNADGESSSSESDYDPSNEDRDLFIAQLHKFHEERASPINRPPVLGGKDIDLYHLYRLVQSRGGARKVTANSKWGALLKKLKLNGCPGANAATLKKAYVRYLEPYAKFEADLGWSIDGKATETSSGSRSERVVPKPGSLREFERKFKRKNETKVGRRAKDIDETKSLRGSKEGSRDPTARDYRSQSPTDWALKRLSDSSNLSVIREEARSVIEEARKRINQCRREDSVGPSRRFSMCKDALLRKDARLARDKRSQSVLYSADDFKRELLRSADSGEDTDDARKRKEKKRMTKKAERKHVMSSSSDQSGDKKDPDEGFQLSNIISHFYMGQKVRAHHQDHWYDARVVEIHQPKSIDILEQLKKGDNPEALTDEAVTELNRLSKTLKCFVHYLGWNSRYDEWISLAKLKIHEKDQHNSRNMIRDLPGGKYLTKHRFALAETCCPGVGTDLKFEQVLENVEETFTRHPLEETPPKTSPPASVMSPNSNNAPNEVPIEAPSISRPGIGISFSTFMSQVASGKDSNLTVRDFAAAAVGLEARARGSRMLLSPPGGRTQKTLLHQVSSEAGLQALRSDPMTRYDAEKKGAAPSVVSPPLIFPTSMTIIPIPQESTTTQTEEEEVKTEDEKETIVPSTSSDEPRGSISPERPDEILDYDDKPNIENEDTAKITPQKGYIRDYETLRKSARKSTIASSTASINAQKMSMEMQSGPLNMSPAKFEMLNNEISQFSKEKSPRAGSEYGMSPKTDNEGVHENGSLPDEERKESSCSPSMATPEGTGPAGRIGRGAHLAALRGSGKRKRAARHSQMVIDRKYQRASAVKKQQQHQQQNQQQQPNNTEIEDNDGEDDESNPIPKIDTFHQMKVRMHKLMEHENSLNDFTLLELRIS